MLQMKSPQMVMLCNKVRYWAFHKKEQFINDLYGCGLVQKQCVVFTKAVCCFLCACVYILQNTLNWNGPIRII